MRTKEMKATEVEVNFNDIGLKPVYLSDCLVEKQVKVVVAGDPKSEHSTYVFNGDDDDKCLSFYFNGYEGTYYGEIIALLKFLGHEVFVVYKNRYNLDDFNVVNYRDYV